MADKMTVTEKILASHLKAGELIPGTEIGITIDQTITQDATGTTAMLLFEAMDIPQTRAELSVSYVDHNTAQFGPENHTDHLYLQSIAQKAGVYYSRAGNGICHQVHLERFAIPGKTQLGSDSHTPTAGGIGAIAIGAGGLDVAVAMAGGEFYTTCPKVIGIELTGELCPWVAPKDIILRLLSILSTTGNVGFVVEYMGEGVKSLSVPARATCTNMGAELGVTTSVFPSDEQTRKFLAAQDREDDFTAISADDDAEYATIEKKLHHISDASYIENIRQFCPGANISAPDAAGYVLATFNKIVIDLSQLLPLAAGDGSPGNIVSVAELEGTKVCQVAIGSCTNSSYQDLMMCANVLAGKTVHPDVELAIAPGSRQVLGMLAANGALADLVGAGARILESACGPCIGQGFSPIAGGVSLRTFNRNFPGRTGTKGDVVYLVSPETAVAGALTGKFVDPRNLTASLGIDHVRIEMPDHFDIDDGMIQKPLPKLEAAKIEIIRGSSIVKPPRGETPADTITGECVIKVGDKITTDHIMPAGTLLKHRSNVPEYAKYVFNPLNQPGKPTFAQRTLAAKEQNLAGVIIAGASYGQGSSREHAALCPMYLGVRVVIAQSIERIHQSNLVNFAILPLIFSNPTDINTINPSDNLLINNVLLAIESGDSIIVRNTTTNVEIKCDILLSARQRKILAAGGLLRYASN